MIVTISTNLFNLVIQSINQEAIIILVTNSSGVYRNLNVILKFGFGRMILEHLFMNFMRAILLSSIAKCLPMHVLAPALKPPYKNWGRLSHSLYHLSGLNSFGFLKYFSE